MDYSHTLVVGPLSLRRNVELGDHNELSNLNKELRLDAVSQYLV